MEFSCLVCTCPLQRTSSGSLVDGIAQHLRVVHNLEWSVAKLRADMWLKAAGR